MDTTSTPSETKDYMILFRTIGWERDLSPEQMQQVLDDVYAWFDDLYRRGVAVAAQPLYDEGKVVAGSRGRLVTDGPFAESKETVAGYLIVHTESLHQAVAIAQTWPMLERGCTAEVRPIAPACPALLRLRAEATHEQGAAS